MGWSSTQQKRLITEKSILKKYFPNFQWINPTDNSKTRVEGYVTTNSGSRYKIRIYIPEDYPNSRPDMVVLEPYPLKGFFGKNIKKIGASGSMHTLEPRDGYVKICHYKEWIGNLTIYLVALKGRIWLEAFDGHRRTGKDMDDYLPHMK